MKSSILLLLFTLLASSQKAPFQSFITTCFNREDYQFCNHKNKSLRPPTKPYLTYGWCCPRNTTTTPCKAAKRVRCTGTIRSKPLYMTYWPG